MNTLLLGYGSHAKKRIVPALSAIKEIDEIVIGDKNQLSDDFLPQGIKVVNFEKALSLEKNWDLTVIATPPINHIENLKSVFNNSKRILIEKPITNDFKFIDDNLNEYTSMKPIYESLMYFHHPLWAQIKAIIKENSINEIHCEFSVPHLDLNNYRYTKKRGGGSLLDQGVYPISLAVEIINKEYKVLNYKKIEDKNYEVDLGGEIELLIDNSISFFGKWSLGFDYKNSVQLTSQEGTTFTSEFIFTKPNNHVTCIEINDNNKISKKSVGDYDQFQLMYEDILRNNLNNFDYSTLSQIKKRYKIIEEINES
jgi:NDP-hexose-3-ketoreductase